MPDVSTTDGPLSAAQALKAEWLEIHGSSTLSYHAWLDQLADDPKLWLIQRSHLQHPARLIARLQQDDHPAVQSLRACLTPRTLQLLALDKRLKDDAVIETLLAPIIEDLNALITSGQTVLRRPGFTPSVVDPNTLAWSQIPRTGKALEVLNRVLIEDAMPEHLARVWDTLGGVFARMHATPRAALCLSGGGIRSATFNLGVLQGLARAGLLPEFHYLSTVSGGGYIGSWLSSWIQQVGSPEPVYQELARTTNLSPTEPEPKPLQHLRRFSNYLTPRLGSFSADTWALIGTYLRNLGLNWLVFVPLLFSALMLPRLIVGWMRREVSPWEMGIVAGVGFLLTTLALAYSVIQRPSQVGFLEARSRFWRRRGDQKHFLLYGLAPLFAGAFCFAACWAWYVSGSPEMPGLPWFIGAGLVLHLASWAAAMGVLRRFLWSEFIAVVVTGGIGGGLLWMPASWAYANLRWPPPMEWYVCIALPVYFAVFLITATLFIGVSSRRTTDADREWWARMGGWILIGVASWAGFSLLVMFGPVVMYFIGPWLTSLGGLPGIAAIALGYGKLTPAKQTTSEDPGLAGRAIRLGLSVAAPLFVAFLVAALSLGATSVFQLVGGFDPPNVVELCRDSPEWFRPVLEQNSGAAQHLTVVHVTPAWMVLILGSGFALFGWVMSRLVNINRFSLHAVYRNRLIRAYLGASNPSRSPNPFTGFDPKDNVSMSRLPKQPFHVVNMALNLVSGDNLAWQQRKAESFTLTPRHAGNARLGYRSVANYAVNQSGHGVSLGTAVTISGAAASPNQGYHSSPIVALLMTFFNVRLGAWLGNPGVAGNATFPHSAPRSAALHFVKEAFGLTDDRNPYVYLSDGGHFENLGLYEMVMRRCHYIVVSDAGCDPKGQLEDLGNAIRKIRVDLGIPITMHKFQIYPRDAKAEERRYCAVGRIDYSHVDGLNARPGVIIYLKPSLCGEEPKDIFNYAETHPDFPHEPTSDQWFSESQFESYRMLGLHTVKTLCSARWATLRQHDKDWHSFTTLVRTAYMYSDVPMPLDLSDALLAHKLTPAAPATAPTAAPARETGTTAETTPAQSF